MSESEVWWIKKSFCPPLTLSVSHSLSPSPPLSSVCLCLCLCLCLYLCLSVPLSLSLPERASHRVSAVDTQGGGGWEGFSVLCGMGRLPRPLFPVWSRCSGLSEDLSHFQNVHVYLMFSVELSWLLFYLYICFCSVLNLVIRQNKWPWFDSQRCGSNR